MRKLYQILYTVGRLTYAPARRAFPFRGDTWAVGVSLSGGHLSSGRFPFRGTLGQWAFPFQGDTWAVGRFARGKGARSYEARFSPSRSPFPGTSLFCVVVCYNVLEKILYSSVLVVWGLCRWVCGERKTKLLLFAISQGTGPLRGPLSRPAEQKNQLSLTPPIQQHTGLSR